MVEKILRILALPKTGVMGGIKTLYNQYTLFMPYNRNVDFTYVLVTALTPFQKRRIELKVPSTEEEEWIADRLLRQKPVFALEQVGLAGAIVVPDHTTRLITREKVKNYPFKKMYVPHGAVITASARDESIEFEEFDSCIKEKFAEAFGQPRKMKL